MLARARNGEPLREIVGATMIAGILPVGLKSHVSAACQRDRGSDMIEIPIDDQALITGVKHQRRAYRKR
jgi:hypothetical protein